MDKPNSVDYVAWARYNEWLSGAALNCIPAKEYADVREEVEGTDTHRSRCDVEPASDRPGDDGPVSGVVIRDLGDDRECSRRSAGF